MTGLAADPFRNGEFVIPDRPAARGPIADDFWPLAAIWAAGRLVVLIAGLLGTIDNSVAEGANLAEVFCTWDCEWYVGIAEEGYSEPAAVDADGSANWAFFPAFPLLLRGFAALTRLDATIAGLILANLLAAVAIGLFHRLARDRFERPAALFATALFGLWPFAVHTSVPMSEALFVPASLALFVALRRRWWIAAGLAGAVLSGTRVVGVFAVLPILVAALEHHGLRRLSRLAPGTETAVLAMALCGLGLSAHMLHLHALTGDALAFSHDQVAWNRRFVWPWTMIADVFLPDAAERDFAVADAGGLATALAGFAAAVLAWRGGRRGEALFVAAPLTLALFSGAAMSLARFTGALFPVVMVVAGLVDRPRLRVLVLAVSAIGLGLATFAWVREGRYVM